MARNDGQNHPSPPVLFPIGSSIRKLFTLEKTAGNLIFESFLLGTLFALGGYLVQVSLLAIVACFLSITIPSLIRFLLLSPDSRDSEEEVIRVPVTEIVIFALIPMVVAGVLFGGLNLIKNHEAVYICTQLVYVGLLESRARVHRGEYQFYTNPRSNISGEWTKGAIALERAVNHYEDENHFLTFYWADVAESTYESIMENEERKMLRNAAGEFSTAARFLSIISFADRADTMKYERAMKRSLNRASQYLSKRVCDSCGSVREIDKITRIINPDGENYIYCQACKQARKKSQSKERTTNSQSNSTDTSNIMAVEDACNVLDISQPVDTEETVHQAYRELVTEVHPDVGGTTEQFKEVKEARDRLIQHTS